MRRLLMVVPALAASLTLAACGGHGGDDAPPVSHAPGSAANPKQAEAQPNGIPARTAAAKDTAKAADGARSNEGGSSAAASPVGYQKLVEQQARKPKSRFTPCHHVSRTEATAIVGAKVKVPLEAPQGPTCIYRTTNTRGFVTLSVQQESFAAATKGLKQRRALTIGGRSAVCGAFGHPTLAVRLTGGRVLNVAAQCGIAKQFAARALQQLKD
jgi:hypothetical protein